VKLTRKGEYALRAVLVLSDNFGKGPLKIREIAREENIPIKFLEQILLELKKTGVLQSKPGIGGGYSLVRPPGEISLAEIIRIIDGPLAPLRCVSQYAPIKCPDEKNCGLYEVMKRVRDCTANILENTTFADINKRNLK